MRDILRTPPKALDLHDTFVRACGLGFVVSTARLPGVTPGVTHVWLQASHLTLLSYWRESVLLHAGSRPLGALSHTQHMNSACALLQYFVSHRGDAASGILLTVQPTNQPDTVFPDATCPHPPPPHHETVAVLCLQGPAPSMRVRRVCDSGKPSLAPCISCTLQPPLLPNQFDSTLAASYLPSVT